MNTRVTNAGIASPTYLQLMSTIDRAIMHPTYANFPVSVLPYQLDLRVELGLGTKISVHPVAHGGIDANIGAKKIAIKKQTPVVTAVSPVFPPSAIPAADSINAVTGDVPRSEPIEMLIASVQYASVDRGKSPVESSTTPENRAIEYSVPVQSRISTYRNVNRANANCEPAPVIFQSCAPRMCWMGWKVTTFLKKSKREAPSGVWGK
jgi:hypothetical protein